MTPEYIKRLMGWCPNAKTAENGEWNCSLSFEAPGQPGGEKPGSLGACNLFSRLYSRVSNQILMASIYLTLLYFALMARWGINPEAFLEGLALSLLLAALLWKKQMHRYDTLAKKPMVSSSGRKKYILTFFAIILLMVSCLVFLPHVVRILFHNMQTFSSFFAGTLSIMWINYLQIVYWERKNQMRICTKSEDGFRTIYSREVSPEGKRGLK